jgi:hypothetical protein
MSNGMVALELKNRRMKNTAFTDDTISKIDSFSVAELHLFRITAKSRRLNRGKIFFTNFGFVLRNCGKPNDGCD